MSAFICAAVLALLLLPAEAATIEVKTINREPAVLITGMLNFGDENVFQGQTAPRSGAIVMFRSIGDRNFTAVQLGRIIKAKRFATAVTDICHSACALAWLGGIRRYMGARSKIGFHAGCDPTDLQRTLKGDMLVAAYAVEMGLSDPAVEWITEKGPRELNHLIKAEADRLGIAVEVYDAEFPPTVSTQPDCRQPLPDKWSCVEPRVYMPPPDVPPPAVPLPPYMAPTVWPGGGLPR
jgi:hypothetical protein